MFRKSSIIIFTHTLALTACGGVLCCNIHPKANSSSAAAATAAAAVQLACVISVLPSKRGHPFRATCAPVCVFCSVCTNCVRQHMFRVFRIGCAHARRPVSSVYTTHAATHTEHSTYTENYTNIIDCRQPAAAATAVQRQRRRRRLTSV